MTSTPGYPYCKEKPTIGEWLGWNGLGFSPYSLARLWHDVQLVFDGVWEHYMKAFIKMEPHKLSKIKLKRWRVIIGFSLPVQVAWKMLFDYQNKKFVEESYHIPCQQGLVLPYGGWKDYLRQWKSRGYNAGTDASAWDWTVSGWLLDAALEMRRRLTRGNVNDMDKWYTLARKLYSDAFDVGARIILPNGKVLRQEFHGLQKSGSPNTIADNSMMRLIASVIVSIQMGQPLYIGRFLGDDALERLHLDFQTIEAMKATYYELGIVIKSVELGVEFAGHQFDWDGPRPLYLAKHLWKLFYTPTDLLADYVDAMARLYCHSDEFQLWVDIASKLNVRLYSREYYVSWYDLPEYDVR